MPEDTRWIRDAADGVVLAVQARPGARRSAIVGVHGAMLAVRVAARPVEGAANRALITLLATTLDIPSRFVTIEGGTTGRAKRIHIAGATAADVAARLLAAGAVDTGQRGA